MSDNISYTYNMCTLAQLSYKIGGAQNNSAPFVLNLDLQVVFSWKTTPEKGPIEQLKVFFCK